MCAERLFWPRRPVSWLPAEKKTGLGEKLHLLLNLSKWGIPDMTNGEINTVAHCYFLASRLPLALALLSGSLFSVLLQTQRHPLRRVPAPSLSVRIITSSPLSQIIRVGTSCATSTMANASLQSGFTAQMRHPRSRCRLHSHHLCCCHPHHSLHFRRHQLCRPQHCSCPHPHQQHREQRMRSLPSWGAKMRHSRQRWRPMDIRMAGAARVALLPSLECSAQYSALSLSSSSSTK